ncbi:MAG TPA: carbohydrate porin [Opitutaceae bacterium]
MRPERRTPAWGAAAAAVPLLLAAALGQGPGPASPAPGPQSPYYFQGQSTWIDQGHPAFNSPYEGPNSFTPAAENQRTFSFSLFLGYQPLPGTEFYYDPEVFQGHALSDTLGMAGFPNGEGSKAAFPNLHYNTSRLFVREVIGLGGGRQKVDEDANQIATSYDADRLTLTLGKLAASDLFDNNAYSHDARSQFLNWALIDSAAWDYPADVVGYTAGFAAQWTTRDWTLGYGIFMEPTVSNGPRLDTHVLEAHGQVLELDRGYSAGSLTGTVRPFVYWNEARMGNYKDALEEPGIADALFETRAYRSKVGLGVSWDQQLTEHLGAFARMSWDDGRAESFAFTEVDRSVALGLSADLGRLGRKNDVFGVAVAVNGIVGAHQAYLAAGGTQGLILGDGGLSYSPEQVIETYYSFQPVKWLSVSPDFQEAWNPGYNRDRGPVAIYAVRVHTSF